MFGEASVISSLREPVAVYRATLQVALDFFALKTMLKVFFTPLYCAQLRQGLNIRMRSFTHLYSHMDCTNAFFPGTCRQRMRISTSTHWWLIRAIAMLSQTFCAAVESVRPLLAHAAVSAAIHSRNAELPASIGIAETQGQS